MDRAREEQNYQAFQTLGKAARSVTKTEIDGKVLYAVGKKLQEYEQKGYRIDGAPATASIYGVSKRTQGSVAPVHIDGDAEKARQRADFMAALDAVRKGQEVAHEAGSNGKTDQRRESEKDAQSAGRQAGAHGVQALPAGRDCGGGNADRADPQATGGGRAAGKPCSESEPRVRRDSSKVIRTAREERPPADVCARIYDAYKAGEHITKIAPRLGLSKYIVEQIILTEARRRGEGTPNRHKAGVHAILTPEQEAQIYKEYVETDATQQDIAKRYGVSEQTIWRTVKKQRLDVNEERKPRKSRKTMKLSDEQIAEMGKRREAGESTEDLAKEAGVSVNVMRENLRRVCGPSRHKARKELDAQERAEIVREYKQGMTYRELIKKHHTHSHRIADILRDAGVLKTGGDRENNVISDNVLDKAEFPAVMQWLNDNAMSIYALAEDMCVKTSRLYMWLVYGHGDRLPKWAIDYLIERTGMSYAELFAKADAPHADFGGGVDQTARIRALEAELADCKETMRKASQRIGEILEAHGYEA